MGGSYVSSNALISFPSRAAFDTLPLTPKLSSVVWHRLVVWQVCEQSGSSVPIFITAWM